MTPYYFHISVQYNYDLRSKRRVNVEDIMEGNTILQGIFGGQTSFGDHTHRLWVTAYEFETHIINYSVIWFFYLGITPREQGL